MLSLLTARSTCALRCVAGRGSVAYRGGAEKDPWGAHEAGAGPSEAAEGGAENHPGEGQVPPQTLLHAQGHRMIPRSSSSFSLLLLITSSYSSSSVGCSLRFGSAEGKRPGVWTRSSRTVGRGGPAPFLHRLCLFVCFSVLLTFFRELELLM